jgi:hypothetical protein
MGGSILDWDDSQPYYERLYSTRWEKDDERLLAQGARNLFSFSLPELRPRNVDAVIRFIRKNRNVQDLRADIASLLARGEKFDATLGTRIVSEVLESELVSKKKLRRFRLLGAAASVLIPGGSLVTEAAIEAASVGGEEVAERSLKRSHRWLYSLREA